MGFGLRGGRPKNMNQGIYWVQRHLADERRVARANEKAKQFNLRFNRITQNVNSFFDGRGQIEVNPKSYERINRTMELYNLAREQINSNIEDATFRDLGKLGGVDKLVDARLGV